MMMMIVIVMMFCVSGDDSGSHGRVRQLCGC